MTLFTCEEGFCHAERFIGTVYTTFAKAAIYMVDDAGELREIGEDTVRIDQRIEPMEV